VPGNVVGEVEGGARLPWVKKVCREEETEGLGGAEAGAGDDSIKALELTCGFKKRAGRGEGE